MIPLIRKRTKSAIHEKFRGEEPVQRLIALMKAEREIKRGSIDKHKFESKWRPTKKQLQLETNGKCAYCETTITESMHGDVEHYRPKSEYWWLAYVYDNYLASCQLCNQKFKKAFFEILDSSKRLEAPQVSATMTDQEIENLARSAIPDPLDQAMVDEFEHAHEEERPLILNPYIDEPSDVFAWKVREIEEIDVVPRAENPEAALFVDVAKRLLGLNRTELREKRFAAYSDYRLFVDILESEDVPEPLKKQVRTQIKDNFASAKSRYAGMIRFFEQERAASGGTE